MTTRKKLSTGATLPAIAPELIPAVEPEEIEVQEISDVAEASDIAMSQQPNQPLKRGYDPVRTLLDESVSGDLLDDGPGVDRTDQALIARAVAFEEAAALNWMMEGFAPEEEAQPEPRPSATDSAVGYAVKSFGELPRQSLGGVRDAAQATLEFMEYLGAEAEKRAPLGGVQLFNEKGELDLEYLWPGELAEKRAKGKVRTPDLPGVRQPETAVGAGVRAIAQFWRPFRVR